MQTSSTHLKSYLRDNPGMLFMFGFLIFLVLAGILFATGNLSDSKDVATTAFFLLILGVVLQIGILVWEENKSSQATKSPVPPATGTSGWFRER